MTIREIPTPGSRWQACLLLALSPVWVESEDGWESLREAHTRANALLVARFEDTPLSVAAMTSRRREMADLVEVKQRGRHYVARLSEAGSREAKAISENPAWGTAESETLAKPEAERADDLYGRRLGKDHPLPRPDWRRMIKAVTAGEMDLVMIPREARTKARYWDEPAAGSVK